MADEQMVMCGQPECECCQFIRSESRAKNARIAELEAALWPLAEIGRYNPSVPDDESILSDNAVFHGGDPGRTTLTMANARHALDVLCPDAGKE